MYMAINPCRLGNPDMCGIVGVWRLVPHGEAMASSLDVLTHRGPDGQACYHDADSDVALGHVRLAIIDLSPAGHQPMLSEEGHVMLTFNGEIYNYRELRAELEAVGVAFVGHSGTEVLLQLYLRDGAAALPRLNGIFAFALYDRRSGELLLARDALGVKPLYISQGARRASVR